MSDVERELTQRVVKPALKPFVKPIPDAPRPVLRAAPVIGGRPTVPPFGPIRYGGPKPGATGSPGATAVAEDDETPTWSSLSSEPVAFAPSTVEPAHDAPAESEPVAEYANEPVTEYASDPVAEYANDPVAEYPSEPEVAAEPDPEPAATFATVNESILDFGVAAEEPADGPQQEPEPEPAAPAATVEDVPFTPDYTTAGETRYPHIIGPSDPTPVINRRVTPPWQRTVDPRRMTPMRVTPLRPTTAVTPLIAPPVDDQGSNRIVATALETVATRVRRGELVVTASVPTGDDPPSLAAALAATLAALLGARG